MKSTKLALAIVVACGILSACEQAAPAPAAEEVQPPMAEQTAVTPPEPMVPDETMPAPADTVPTDVVEDDDMPHSGGDRVGTGGGNQEAGTEGSE